MIVYDAQGKIITLSESIGRGGEAVVYGIRNQENCLAKIYISAPRAEYPAKLGWMTGHAPENPTLLLSHPSLAWPEGLLYDSRRSLVGYRMPYIRGAVPLIDVFNPRRRGKILPGFDRRYLHRTARNLVACLDSLHRSGYAAGDLNESNVMVTPTALVSLIDTDSFQVVERDAQGTVVIHPCPVGKPEYTPPELQGRPAAGVMRRAEHDLFALGVLIFQLLVEGSHPFRAQWLGGGDPPPIESRIARGLFPYGAGASTQVRPPLNSPGLDSLHPELAELFRRCFVDGHQKPELRPSPREWERGLSDAEATLLTCPRGHLFAGHLFECPYCRNLDEQHPRPRPGPASRPQAAARAHTSYAGAAGPAPIAGAPPTGWGTAPPPRRRSSGPGAGQWFQTAARVWHWYQSSRTPQQRWAWTNPAAPFPGSVPYPPSGGAFGQVSPRPGSSPSSSISWTASVQQWRQAMQPASLWRWARPRLTRSLLVGGGTGLAAGAFSGSLAAVAAGATGDGAAWSLLWGLGGAAAGLLRGWHPGYQLGLWIEHHIGWRRMWQIVGLLGGASLGALFGFVIGWWAIIPIFIGLFLGARKGMTLGAKIWLLGARLGWNRILTVTGALGAALVGWLLASWAGSGPGAATDQWAVGLSDWLLQNSLAQVWTWSAVGALGGALGGALSGVFTDLFARLSGLTD